MPPYVLYGVKCIDLVPLVHVSGTQFVHERFYRVDRERKALQVRAWPLSYQPLVTMPRGYRGRNRKALQVRRGPLVTGH